MISQDASLYPDPEKFDGLRFFNRRQAAAGTDAASKNQFASTSPQQMHFGFGRQACPGRFFASASIKAVVLGLVEGFEMRLGGGGGGGGGEGERPKNRIKGAMSFPSETAEVEFRRRRKGE